MFTGLCMIVLAAAFFYYMAAALAPKSNDPVALMPTVDQVSGVVGDIGLVMIVLGLIGRKEPQR